MGTSVLSIPRSWTMRLFKLKPLPAPRRPGHIIRRGPGREFGGATSSLSQACFAEEALGRRKRARGPVVSRFPAKIRQSVPSCVGLHLANCAAASTRRRHIATPLSGKGLGGERNHGANDIRQLHGIPAIIGRLLTKARALLPAIPGRCTVFRPSRLRRRPSRLILPGNRAASCRRDFGRGASEGLGPLPAIRVYLVVSR